MSDHQATDRPTLIERLLLPLLFLLALLFHYGLIRLFVTTDRLYALEVMSTALLGMCAIIGMTFYAAKKGEKC